MSIEVTSVSKRPERISEAAASIYVISREDIRRSGATSVVEALRLAPNLQVVQQRASGYSVSSRGFNASSANKLLVLIDGRSVYTPLFSGVFWDVQDVVLEDIERIEVISGPGGTLWGTNAVNGVINIVTLPAKETHGGLVAAGGGNRENGIALRQGATLGAEGNYRVYAKYFDRNHTSKADGSPVDDAWHMGQAGFRADWDRASDQLTVHGDVYRGAEAQPPPGTIAISGANLVLGIIPVSGANLTARWAHRLDGGSTLALQAYYDRTERTVPPTFAETLDIVDVQIQHSLQPAGMHTLVWGAGHRQGRDRVVNSQYFAFLPAKVDQKWTSLFAQDEMALREDLRLTFGARVERNDYTGTEFLPNARLAWKPLADHLLWFAASRAVRSPSRLDHDAFVPGNPPFQLAGGPNVRSELANVYEAGYRGTPAARITFSATAFHAEYDHLRSQEPTAGRFPVFFASEMEGKSRGVEVWGTYQASRTWRLSAGLLAQRLELVRKPASTDPFGPSALGNDPHYQWLLRSSVDLTASLEMDVMLRHVAALPNPAVPSYTAVAARLGWRVRPDVELSVVVQNLADPAHAEFGPPATRSELGRGVFAKILWRL